MKNQVAELRALLERCIDPIEDRILNNKNERALYDGYELRQKRYDRLISEDEELLAAVRAAVSADEPNP